MRTIGFGTALAAIVLVLAMPAATAPTKKSELLKDEKHFLVQSNKTYTGGQKAAKIRNMEVVGRNSLGGRGFNADVWVHEGYAYIGHWGFSDWASGSKTRFCPSPPKNGVAVVDATNPSDPVMVSRLVNPTGTSAEDVTVFTAKYGTARRSRHRRGRNSGLRRLAARPELSARAQALRRDRSDEPGEPRTGVQHGLLHPRPPRARVRTPRRPRSDLHLRVGARERERGGRFAERIPRPAGTGRLQADRRDESRRARGGLRLGRHP